MTGVLLLLQTLHLLLLTEVPAGSQLRVRLTTPVASWSSTVDTPVSAVLIAPVFVNGRQVVPAGCILTGRISSVHRVGWGIRHERASLGMEFTELTLPGGKTNALSAQITQVDNGRERVMPNGDIRGIRATGSVSYRVSGYIKTLLLWQFHAELAGWAIKSLVVQLPEPEIYYPAGTELVLSVRRQLLSLAAAEQDQPSERLAGSELADLRHLVAAMPGRTNDPGSGRPSDPANVLLLGTRAQINAAFLAAGWNRAQPLTLRSRIGSIRAVAEGHGYAAPMNPLFLNGLEADMNWEKRFNDVSKRHHIRMWKQPGRWNGQELWIAAATRDIDLAYMRPGRALTHRIDPNIDEEREKVVYDLAFTSCASPLAWIDRADVPPSAHNGTGDAFFTDTRLAVVRLGECPAAAVSPGLPEIAVRGGKWQRFVRREILVARSDLIRNNPYWRTYEALRWAFDYTRERKPRENSEPLPADLSLTASPGYRQTLRVAWLWLH